MLAIKGGKPYRTEPFSEWPKCGERELELIKEVLDSGSWWRATGKKVATFEKQFAQFQDAEYCLGVTSGTHALEIALLSLGVRKGDEVILPAFTYISTAVAVINCNATPVLVDVDLDTYCMKSECFESSITEKTKVVIPVHLAGNSCDMNKICEIAKKNNIKVLEDAAHGHGGEYEGHRLGSIGDMGIFSFQNGKLMTSGEGGAIVTNSKDLYDNSYLRHGVGRPICEKGYHHDVLGSTARMNEFQGAILIAQMERVNSLNCKREKSAAILDEILADIEGIIPQKRSKGSSIFTHYMYMFRIDSTKFGGLTRNQFVEYLKAEGIPCNISFPVVSDVEFFKNQDFDERIEKYDYENEQKLSNSRLIAEEAIWLPHCVLEGAEQDLVDIKNAIKKIQAEMM